METISIYDVGAIWDVAKPNTQASVCHMSRMIGIGIADRAIELPTSSPVQTSEFRNGEVVLP